MTLLTAYLWLADKDASVPEHVGQNAQTWFKGLSVPREGLSRETVSLETIFLLFLFEPLCLMCGPVVCTVLDKVVSKNLGGVLDTTCGEAQAGTAVLVYSMTKRLRGVEHVEGICRLVGRIKVGTRHVGPVDGGQLEAVHPGLLHHDRSEQHRESSGWRDVFWQDSQYRVGQAVVQVADFRAEQRPGEHDEVWVVNAEEPHLERDLRPRQCLPRRVEKDNRRNLNPEVHRRLEGTKLKSAEDDSQMPGLMREREVYSRILDSYASCRLYLDAEGKFVGEQRRLADSGLVFGVDHGLHADMVFNDTVEKVMRTLFVDEGLLFADAHECFRTERGAQLAEIRRPVFDYFLGRLITLIENNRDAVSQADQIHELVYCLAVWEAGLRRLDQENFELCVKQLSRVCVKSSVLVRDMM